MKSSESRSTLVIGAGPTGLSTAYKLALNKLSVEVLEASPDYVGGLARTEVRDGYRFDIGGHRFYTGVKEIMTFWKDILGSNFIERKRLSRIYYGGKYFRYPLEPLEALYLLGPVYAVHSVLSYIKAHLFPRKNEDTFEDWIVNRFGLKLYETFFKSYTEKVWGIPCNQISSDWAAQRIRGLSIATVIKQACLSLLGRKKSNVRTLIDRFYYPRLGPGELWEKVAEKIHEMDGQVHMDNRVKSIQWEDRKVTSLSAEKSDGSLCNYEANEFVSTMPLGSLIKSLDPKPPEEVLDAADQLGTRHFIMVAVVLDAKELFADNWIYIHDPQVKVGRIQNFKNWSPDLVPDDSTTCLGLEYFCSENDDLWNLTDKELEELAVDDLNKLGLSKGCKTLNSYVVRVTDAYPVYHEGYQEAVTAVRDFLEDNLDNLQVAGRGGMHRYNNQDHACLTGFVAARNIIDDSREYSAWNVNEAAEYLEDEGAGQSSPLARLAPLINPALKSDAA